jgi:hypothetical protein
MKHIGGKKKVVKTQILKRHLTQKKKKKLNSGRGRGYLFIYIYFDFE